MSKEEQCITINIGECGIRFGNTVWENYFVDHKINKDGTLKQKFDDDNYNALHQEI